MSGDRIELALRGYEQASQPAALELREQASPARAKILGEQFCGKSAYPPILSVNADMRAQRLSADIVAKVPNRWELIFLLLKKSTDDH